LTIISARKAHAVKYEEAPGGLVKNARKTLNVMKLEQEALPRKAGRKPVHVFGTSLCTQISDIEVCQ